MTELQIQDAIRVELGNPRLYPDVLIFRNNVGVLQDRNGRHVRYGLCPGSSDLIGIFTPDLSDPVGVFIAAEIKTPTGKESDEQRRFGALVTSRGGFYAVLRSVDDARRWVKWLRKREDLDG